jgi:hypothetical protein
MHMNPSSWTGLTSHSSEPIEVEGGTFPRYRGTDVVIGKRGTRVRDQREVKLQDCLTLTIDEHLPPEV